MRRWIVSTVVAAAVAMLVVPAALQLPLAVGHAQFHALFALGVLLPAAAIAWRSQRATVASTAPIIGLTLLALAQLVESVGGLGYGPGNDVRVNRLAEVHDLALALTSIGLGAALLGVTLGVGAQVGRKTGRPVAGAISALVVLLVGGFAVAKMIGL